MSMKIRRGSKIISAEQLITDCSILTPTKLAEKGRILIGQGRIIDCGKVENVPAPSRVIRHSFKGCTAVPGFIDIHLHGASGILFSRAPAESIAHALNTHLLRGTTACLPTLMTGPEAEMRGALAAINEAAQSGAPIPEMAGINLEGPFLSEEKRGVHEKRFIRPIDSHDIEKYRRTSPEIPIRIVTVAPEREGAMTLIRDLADRGIIAAAGHTNATYDLMLEAIGSGVKLGTHLFNAMRGIFHREPGAAGALLLNDDVYVEVIADGEHLHPALFRLIARAKSSRRIIVITDASPDYGNKTCATRTDKGTLVGSNLPLPGALKLLMKHSELTLPEVLMTVTVNPARLLGLQGRIGSLRRGADADIVILDDTLAVKAVFRKGDRVL